MQINTGAVVVGQIHDLKGLGMHHLATGPIAMLRKVSKDNS